MKVDFNNQSIGSVGNVSIERTNALTLMYDSKEYYNYYKRGKLNKKTDLSKPSYFLTMRSLELALKAILKIREGINIFILKKDFGHDVYKLYSYCIKKGYLKPLNKEDHDALKILNVYYTKKDFEYTKMGTKVLPKVSYITNMVEDIYTEFKNVSQNTKVQRYL